MEDRLVPAMARIKNASGNVVGVGLLVYPRGVLTCAHVVNQALGRPSNSLPKPAEQEALYLDFPTSLPGTTFTAKVALWSPLAQLPDGVYDIAGLTLAEAVPGILPMRLVDAGDLADHPFHAYGFPPGHDAGVWVKGRIVGKRVSGWFQLEAGGTSVYSLREGFSGGPVWDETVKGVVGIVA